MPNLQQNQSIRETLRAGKVLTVTVTTGSVGVNIPSAAINKTITATESFGPFDVDVHYRLAAFASTISSYDVADLATFQDRTSRTIKVSASRELNQSDNGLTLDCASGVVLTIPPGLENFGFAARPEGVQIACGAGVTVNGASSTVTTTARVAAINPTATANAYDGVGV